MPPVLRFRHQASPPNLRTADGFSIHKWTRPTKTSCRPLPLAAERHITSRSAGDRSVLAIAKVAVAKARQDSPGGWGRLLNRVAHPLEFGFSKGAVFDFVFFLGCTAPSKKGQKFFNRHSRCPDQRSECSARELFVLWDREIRSHSGFCHHYVTSDLPHDLPARFAEGFHRFLAGNVAEPPHLLSRQLPSNSDDHRCAIRPERLHRLLILRP